MSNFQFLHKEWPELYKVSKDAEDKVNTEPCASLWLARAAIEKGIYWLFNNDSRLQKPDPELPLGMGKKNSLNGLITSKEAKQVFNKKQRNNFRVLSIIGNAGTHMRSLKLHEKEDVKKFSSLENIDVDCFNDLAHVAIRWLFEFCSYLVISYAEIEIDIPVFDVSKIPTGKVLEETKQQLDNLKKEIEELFNKERELELENEILLKENEEKGKLLAKRAATRNKKVKLIPSLIPESVTRKLFIDVQLKESGWTNLIHGKDLEYEVKGMPKTTNRSGLGYVDYVLWDAVGKPLAVIEAKKTSVSPKAGKQQALLYANCLEQIHGQRPLIFYSNGYDTFFWDDTFYPERQVQGFFTKDELQLMLQRRDTRKDLRLYQINREIAGRPYQLEAIQRVAENFARTAPTGELTGGKRESLMVMATGSGKTRTAVAIVDMLTKCNWAKRVLFLADRNALVTQAKNAFNDNLPDLTAIDLTKEKEDQETRLVFSTYPTIMNKIDSHREGDKRFYGSGHFDLIIIDEAHRSVYQKYHAIFEYFDSLLIGLTATPKKDIDHNTYKLFGVSNNDPTFAYELEEAVKDGYLVPPKVISADLKFPSEGIKYNDLSESEKEEYEENFGDPTLEEAPEIISNSAVNQWLFNTDTVDKALDHLMRDGRKVMGGDKLGKTIIFAKNHKHAIFIEKRFNENYPEYKGKFLRVIDNYESKAQDLLEKFTDAYQENDPQIAVSVDMMDTGIDAPRVVNLVFFKAVKSRTKFWQMIGRGTRLCPNLYGPGDDKKDFLIFDYCRNFEFFEEHPEGAKSKNQKSLLQKTFESKAKVAYLIDQLPSATSEQQEIRNNYLKELHQSVIDLDEKRFRVQAHMRQVNEYRHEAKWQNLSQNDLLELSKHIAPLILGDENDDELARRFDFLILSYQLVILSGSGKTERYKGTIYKAAKGLQKLNNIPQVARHIPFLKEVQTEQYWDKINVKKLDELRLKMRDLIKFLEIESQITVYTHFKDEIAIDPDLREPIEGEASGSMLEYRERVEKYVRDNKHHVTISKLLNNQPITEVELEELERILFTSEGAHSKKLLAKEFGDMPLGYFVRSIFGLNQEAAQEAFSRFMQQGQFSANQMNFMNTIIRYLTVNGTIDKKMLAKPPFTEIHDQGITGVFAIDRAKEVIKIIDEINKNAGAA
tara:strand:- start:126 stop:3632 length:3507 start_codon:yes stop_codon:yes gene_type:complete